MTGSSVAVSWSWRRIVTHKGKLYSVRIDLSVPGHNIHVGRVGPENHAHEDVYVALRDSFNAAGRLLEDHVRRMRGDVKTHAERQD